MLLEPHETINKAWSRSQTQSVKCDLIQFHLMYLFKMLLHAWENHNDGHHGPEQQQEGESQPADGGVVRWWTAWWQEAGGRAAQTRCLGGEETSDWISWAYILIYTLAKWWGRTLLWRIIMVMHAWLANDCERKAKRKHRTLRLLSTQPILPLVQASRHAGQSDLQWQKQACDESCHHNKSPSPWPLLIRGHGQAPCVIQPHTALRCVRH